jgi:MinD-like ATPase involved in chromosome partitioning or flagellar assembly
MRAKKVFEVLNEIETIVNVNKLSDIVKHLQGKENFAVISAYQKGKTNEENSQNTKKLLKYIKGFSPKVIPLTGEWDKNIPEKSFFVLQPEDMKSKDFLSKIKKISDAFNQDSFLYSKKSDILIVNKDKSVDDIGDDLNITNSYVGFKFK